MDAILEGFGPVEIVREAAEGQPSRPKPEWVRGKCPKCGDDLISNCYYVGSKGHLVCHECWASLGNNPTCDYRKVL